MRRVVISPFYPVADKLDTSHRAGWARYWAHSLGAELFTTKDMTRLAELKKGDELYLYHGMEWSGAMNLQSGLTDEIVARAIRLESAARRGIKIYSCDVPMPAYGRLLGERGFEHGEALDNALRKMAFIRCPLTDPKTVIMGDSHSLSQYVPGAVIYRTDGQTLHGALQVGLGKRLENWSFETGVELERLPKLVSYFGNIDIRHHLMRQEDPNKAVKDLVAEYLSQLSGIQRKHRVKKIEVVMPLPIENECRVLPKTGWYKGTPFYGSWAERNVIRLKMVNAITNGAKKHGLEVYNHPKHFVNPKGELSFDVMEQPRSVHIKPAEYRLVQEKKGW